MRNSRYAVGPLGRVPLIISHVYRIPLRNNSNNFKDHPYHFRFDINFLLFPL